MTIVNDKTFPKLQYIVADNIHSPKVSAVFATRNGGVSGGTPETEHFHSLNLQFNSDDDSHSNITENYRIITLSQGFKPDDVMTLQQIHSDKIVAVDGAFAERCPDYRPFEADALVTNMKGILLSIRTADCVPILLYDSVNGAIGAVHAGWQGTFRQIGTKTVRRMSELYGTNPADIRAAIGPSIGVCCYEVGTDFHSKFHTEYGEPINRFFRIEDGKKPYCDLKEMNKSFLVQAGIPEENIEVSELCTMCNPELFYSHRRSGVKRGTMAAFIGMKL